MTQQNQRPHFISHSQHHPHQSVCLSAKVCISAAFSGVAHGYILCENGKKGKKAILFDFFPVFCRDLVGGRPVNLIMTSGDHTFILSVFSLLFLLLPLQCIFSYLLVNDPLVG